MNEIKQNRKIADYLFIFSCFTLAASISVSKFTTSVSIFLMAIAWFLQWNWKEKLAAIKSNRLIFLLSVSGYLIFAIGALYSEDVNYALKDLKVKAPIFSLPVLFLTGVRLNKKQILAALIFLCSSAITATIIGMINYNLKLGTDQEISDLRLISPFISQIRLSLILSFGFGFSLWGIQNSHSKLKWFLTIPIIWTLYYFYFTASLTGVVLVPVIILFFILSKIYHLSKVSVLAISCFAIITVVYTSLHVLNIADLVLNNKPLKADLINPNKEYKEYPDRPDTENGYTTWKWINETELKQEWEKISPTNYDSELNGFPFKDVIIRYLTSKGVAKDSAGIATLSELDISSIEKGIANEYYVHHNSLASRIHLTFWEMKKLDNNGFKNGNSITMRIEYWKTGLDIFSSNMLIGVGTGDIKNEYARAYKNTNSKLNTKFQRRSHNQYLSVLITSGILGLIIFIASILIPLINYNNSLKTLYQLAVIILLISMLWEDTIESQAGATIFGLFISIFRFSKVES